MQKIYSVGINEKKLFLWSTAAAQADEKHGNKWDLTWYLQWEI